MAPFEVDDISTADMKAVKQITAAFMSSDSSGRSSGLLRGEQELAQNLDGLGQFLAPVQDGNLVGSLGVSSQGSSNFHGEAGLGRP